MPQKRWTRRTEAGSEEQRNNALRFQSKSTLYVTKTLAGNCAISDVLCPVYEHILLASVFMIASTPLIKRKWHNYCALIYGFWD